jgi:hypothetical protein
VFDGSSGLDLLHFRCERKVNLLFPLVIRDPTPFVSVPTSPNTRSWRFEFPPRDFKGKFHISEVITKKVTEDSPSGEIFRVVEKLLTADFRIQKDFDYNSLIRIEPREVHLTKI